MPVAGFGGAPTREPAAAVPPIGSEKDGEEEEK
jgi:hypothetical protein